MSKHKANLWRKDVVKLTCLIFASCRFPSGEGEGHLFLANNMACLVSQSTPKALEEMLAFLRCMFCLKWRHAKMLGLYLVFYSTFLSQKAQGCENTNLKIHQLSLLSFKGQFLFWFWSESGCADSPPQQQRGALTHSLGRVYWASWDVGMRSRCQRVWSSSHSPLAAQLWQLSACHGLLRAGLFQD